MASKRKLKPVTPAERLNRSMIFVLVVFLSGVVTIVGYLSDSWPFKRSRHIPLPEAGETEYNKLASLAFCRDFINKDVTFRAQFLAEWTETRLYEMYGVPTQGRIFLNHRNVAYTVSNSALASSDSDFPPFPLSIPTTLAQKIYSLHKGDFILVQARVRGLRKPDLPVGEPPDGVQIDVEANQVEIVR